MSWSYQCFPSLLFVYPFCFLKYLFLLQVLTLIEEETRPQTSCRKWFVFRAGRVTASNAKAVCATSVVSPSESLTQRLCYPDNHRFTTKATAWGIEKEEGARKMYIDAQSSRHVNFQCRKSGLHLSPTHPWLGASPDGVVRCECCGEGVLEVKCPYSGRDCTIVEYICLESSSLALPDGECMRLKRKHAHFYQVQMQMYVCNLRYCDYVVWTTEEIYIERIPFDVEFAKAMVSKCTNFFKCVLLPELLYKAFSKPLEERKENRATYCYCNGPEQGKMVLCDNPQCERKWFHRKCVGAKRAPRKQWLCNHCK